jgi:tRNA threonylcarbamoyladenosine biosynthesis protein TsaB
MNKKKETIHLLALETSGLTSGVYISAEDKLAGQITLHQRNIHSRKLAQSVINLLKLLDLERMDLSAIILSAGPGSFTGLRIGYSLAKGMAHALKLPLVEIPTLDVWAYQIGETQLPVFSFVDAHRDELFYAMYHWSGQELKRDTQYELSAFNGLRERIEAPILVTGTPLSEHQTRFREILGENAVFPKHNNSLPDGQALLSLGFKKYKEGKFSSLENSEPMYMRAFKGIM